MSNNQSWRHHYLPRFYLDGFTKELGKIKIYDVKNMRFVRKGDLLSTKSYFYEENGNTVILNDGKSSDFIEKLYAHIDNVVVDFFKKIRSEDSSSRYGMNEYYVQYLNYFVSVMYWRLPQNQSKLDKIVQQSSFRELAIKIVDQNGIVNHEIQEQMRKDLAFRKAYKAWKPIADTIGGFNCRTPYHIIAKHPNLPYIISDNPIIIQDPNSRTIHSDDYIFPLSGSRYFLRARQKPVEVLDFAFWSDCLIFKQAINYVTCTDERYIEQIEEYLRRNDIDEQELRDRLFALLR